MIHKAALGRRILHNGTGSSFDKDRPWEFHSRNDSREICCLCWERSFASSVGHLAYLLSSSWLTVRYCSTK